MSRWGLEGGVVCNTHTPVVFSDYTELRWSGVQVGDIIRLDSKPMRVTEFMYQRRNIVIKLSSLVCDTVLEFSIPC